VPPDGGADEHVGLRIISIKCEMDDSNILRKEGGMYVGKCARPQMSN
jgi:hypothetical protein